MQNLFRVKFFILLAMFSIFSAFVNAQDVKTETPVKQSHRPVIIIPGLNGTELANKNTNEVVWFKPGRSKDDDLRLPISPNLAQNRDSLVPKDIIRSVQIIKFFPDIEIYERLINALETNVNYKEGKWDSPPKDGFEDTFYIFAYDWRLDNVENARNLIKKIELLKRKLKKPNLKFDIIAHSMGGLIARYAAMYGDAPLPTRNPRPTWAGSRHLDKIFMLGTPNEGSIQALDSLLNGFSYIGGGLNLPFVQNLSHYDTFSIQSIYQLLPQDGTNFALDENLKPLKIDLYNPKTWELYKWAAYEDADFKKKFSEKEQRLAKPYLAAVLTRAKQFQNAINANTREKIPVTFFVMGSDCKETQNSVIIYKDKKGNWKTLTKGSSFEKAGGEKVSEDEVKKAIYTMGDGVVTKTSLKLESISADSRHKFMMPIKNELFLCETHNKLASNLNIKEKIFGLIWGEEAAVKVVNSNNQK